MIYLDNAATSFPKAPSVAETVAGFLASAAANPGRSAHRMAVETERRIDDVRLRLTRLIGGDDPRRMIFTLNGTDALNIAIKGALAAEPDGAHVVATVVEHNSVARPLRALADAGRVCVTWVDCDEQGHVDPADIAAAMTDATRLVVMIHASNVTGAIQDAAAVGRVVRAHGALFCLDAAQTIGLLPIDVDAMNVDLLAFPAHKALLGPPGVGGLWVGPRCDPVMRPWREGGTGGDSSSPAQPVEWPHRLEAGTANTAGIIGLGAALKRPIEGRLAHERELRRMLMDRLEGDGRFAVVGPRDSGRCVGVVSLNVAGSDPHDVAAILDDSFDIAVRAGLHCAPGVHRRLGTFPAGTVRASFGPFNTEADVDRLAHALDQIA